MRRRELTFGIPFGDFGSLLSSVVGLLWDGLGILLVVLTPFEDLLEYGRGEIGQGDRIIRLSHVFPRNPNSISQFSTNPT